MDAQPHPFRQKRPAKRQSIIDAARRVFLSHGFAGAGVDAIAAEAKVSKQTVYNHFGDKEALFRAVVHAAQAGVDQAETAELERVLSDSGDLGADLRRLGRRWVAMVLRDDAAALRRLVIAEWGRHPWLLDEWRRPGADFEAALSRAIARQAERGVLEVDDPGLAARQLMLLVITESLTRALYGLRPLSDGEASQIVDEGIDMWLRCYQPRPLR